MFGELKMPIVITSTIIIFYRANTFHFSFSTYPVLQFFSNEWTEDLPYHLEDEGLFHHVNFFQPCWHSDLDETKQFHAENWIKSSHLF